MNDESSNTSAPDHSGQNPFSTDFRIASCGFAMGAADIVPGVSGGTVALILGVYERLIAAITRCDATFLKLLFSRQWRAAADHIDLRFITALGCGIAVGIGGLASLMTYLLSNQMSFTFAVFTGMIIASSMIVARRIPKWNIQLVGMLLLGSVVALRLVTLSVLQNPPESLWYLYLCGMIGITAMILPGISGAFILLLLNRYHYITDSIKGLVHGNIDIAVITALFVFGMGCLTGLLSFSRVLRWLLSRYHDETMAVLCGFMLGSLYKLWPFQRDATPDVEKFKHKTFENFIPDAFTSQVWVAIVLCVCGVSVVLLLDVFGRRTDRTRTAESDRQTQPTAGQ
ncbi:MAG TPA: DUF368 domain-containing protein [Planctomycetes bacterium]|nr:DUF368 domain-containing protein [Fuerstiella sp.]HIK93272.1 DUF368 domain-containing protein [Planctomycetota bacterium]